MRSNLRNRYWGHRDTGDEKFFLIPACHEEFTFGRFDNVIVTRLFFFKASKYLGERHLKEKRLVGGRVIIP